MSKLTRMAIAAACVLVLGCCGTRPPASCPNAPTPAPERDYKKIAQQIVEGVRVKQGDAVFVFADPRDVALMDEIWVACKKLGAEVLLVYSREKLDRRYFDEVPASFDSMPLRMEEKLAAVPTVEIAVFGYEFPDQFKDVPPERMTATGKAWEPIAKLKIDRGIRSVFLWNGLYPTEATARQFGITKAQLEKLYWDGLATDSRKLTATGEAVRGMLEKGKEVHITNPNGTDLRMSIAGRPVFVNDGVISDADIQKGKAFVMKYLPAGEVYLAPVQGSAEGRVVVDHFPWEGGEIRNLTVTVAAGKVTAMTGEPAALFERFKKQYDAAPAGKELFENLDFGINPDVKFPEGAKPITYVPAGMTMVGIGNNMLSGGDISVQFSAAWFLPGSTVTVDGNVLIDKGELKVPAKR